VIDDFDGRRGFAIKKQAEESQFFIFIFHRYATQ
jgi:hypothetical protein